MKLQSPGSGSRPRILMEGITTPVRTTKGPGEYRPELYELLVMQYKHLTNNKASGILTPDSMSPRFYKNRPEKFKPTTPLTIYRKIETANQGILKQNQEANLSNKPSFLIRSGKKRIHSLKNIKRLRKNKL